ncbi:MAG TPA: hypothetical protein VFC40_02300 [Syntrophomonas sp.]|nr:hypothetical protein [Syntrophomonas sp.]
MDRGWILDDDDAVNVVTPINLRVLNDIAKTYHQPNPTSIEIRHQNEAIKNLHQMKEEIHSVERIYNTTFIFTPDLR